MKINVSFLIVTKKDKKTPMLACIKESENLFFVPTFEFTNEDYPDLFGFVRKKFKEISGLNAIDITGKGWSYLHMAGSFIKNDILHIVYGTLIPETIKIDNSEWINLFEILEKDLVDNNIIQELLYCFNDISR